LSREAWRHAQSDVFVVDLISQNDPKRSLCVSPSTSWNAIHAKSSSYICRVQDKINYEIIESKKLTPADIEAGVISDQPNQANLRDDLLLHERLSNPYGFGPDSKSEERFQLSLPKYDHKS